MWRLVLVLWQYGAYLHLGSFALLNRELPGLLVKGERARLITIRQTAFWGTVAVTALVAASLLAFGIVGGATNRTERAWALGIVSVGLLAQQISLYVLVQFRVESRFAQMSLQGFVEAFAGLLLMLPLAFVAGVPGLALGLTVSTGIAAALFARRDMFDPPRLELKTFARQAVAGAPLSGLPFLNATIASVGQIVVASALGIEAAGFYGLGLMVGMVVYAVPNAVGLVLYPRYLTSYATTSDRSYVRQLLRRSVRLTTIISASIVSIGALLLNPLYHLLFPRYVAALSTSYALIAMMPFVAYALVLQNALIALRKHPHVIAIQVAAVGLSAGLSLVGALIFHDVAWVAIGVMLANVGSGLATLWLGLSATRSDAASPFREVVVEITPVLVLGAITFGMVKLQGSSGGRPILLVLASELALLGIFIGAFGLTSLRMLRARHA
jgi:O-antigen/teichoic acid export membrane protein